MTLIEATSPALDATTMTDAATAPPAHDPHRAAHRVGFRSKIERDPELAAFVRDRTDRLTFPELAAEIAARVPPERRVSKSGLHRWWTRHVAPTRRTP